MRKQPDLASELINRDPLRGGVTILDTGTVGVGKTALMIHTLRKLFDHKRKVARSLEDRPGDEKWAYQQIANEKIFWIGDEDCQYRRFPNEVAQKMIFVEDGLELKFYLNGEPIDVKSVPFVDFSDIMDYADLRKLNVVYIRDPLNVMDFVQFLIDESLGEWVSVAIDEVEDIAPAYARAGDFDRAQNFSRRLARARKANVSIYATLQSDSQLDWRTPNIVPFRGLCRGSKRPKGWKIFEYVAGNVPIGEAHIATRAQFQKIEYPPYTRNNVMKAKGMRLWTKTKDQLAEERAS